MAGVAVATPTLPVPHQHFALLSLLATPALTCWLIILCFGHTNFGNHPPPMHGKRYESVKWQPNIAFWAVFIEQLIGEDCPTRCTYSLNMSPLAQYNYQRYGAAKPAHFVRSRSRQERTQGRGTLVTCLSVSFGGALVGEAPPKAPSRAHAIFNT